MITTFSLDAPSNLWDSSLSRAERLALGPWHFALGLAIATCGEYIVFGCCVFVIGDILGGVVEG